MAKKKVTVSEAVKQARVTKIKDYENRADSYRVDLGDHGIVIDVEAESPAEARKAALKHFNETRTLPLPATLTADKQGA